MTAEDRVLLALPVTMLIPQKALLKKVRMTQERVIEALANLADEGLAERFVAVGVGSSRPAYLWRRKVAA